MRRGKLIRQAIQKLLQSTRMETICHVMVRRYIIVPGMTKLKYFSKKLLYHFLRKCLFRFYLDTQSHHPFFQVLWLVSSKSILHRFEGFFFVIKATQIEVGITQGLDTEDILKVLANKQSTYYNLEYNLMKYQNLFVSSCYHYWIVSVPMLVKGSSFQKK